MWKNWKPIKFPWTKELERRLNLREKIHTSRVVSWAKVTSVCEVWVQFAVCWSDTKAVSYLFPKTPRVRCVEPEQLSVLAMGQNPPTVLGSSHKEQVQGRQSQGFSAPAAWLSRGLCDWLIVRVSVTDRGHPDQRLFLALSESLSGWD